ncbi:MAG: hypothetical protein JNL70_08465 [Saprospiraceae bacterium]|nr:hypothetical protein [Saprospiraceae bacterium]
MFLDHLKNQSVPVRIWAISVIIAAVYGLVKIIFFPALSNTDYLIMAYTHLSLLVSFFMGKK